MSQAQQNKEYRSFIKGIITEANELNHPEDSSVDEENFEMQRDGSRIRRRGIDYESGHSLSSNIADTNFQNLAVSVHRWDNVDNVGGLTFFVVQVGTTIHFYNAGGAVSAGKKSFTVDLTSFSTGYKTPLGSSKIDAASGKGILVIVNEAIDPFYVEYDNDLDTISTTQIDIKVRDFLGIDDTLTVAERPASLTDSHKYNLYNQGWLQSHIATYKATGDSLYPSNAQIWTLGKDSNDDFDRATLDKVFEGNAPAPKGHFIIPVFDRDRDAQTGETDQDTISSLTTEVEKGRPKTCVWWSGRIWYAGVVSDRNAGPAMNSYLMFSQIMKEPAQLSKCHQEGDPTSETNFDLLASDGGVVEIPEVGVIHKLIPLGGNLVVFANNGVWVVSGNTQAGFSATGFKVGKVTELGSISASSVIKSEGVIFYWGKGGIYLLEPVGDLGVLKADNISILSVQTLYDDVPEVSKDNVSTAFDPITKEVIWMYKSTALNTTDAGDYDNRADSLLIFNGALRAFNKYSISSLASNTPYIYGAGSLGGVGTEVVTEGVTDSAVAVTDSAVAVTSQVSQGTSSPPTVYYLTVEPQGGGNSKLTWSLFNNSDLLDWEKADSTGIIFSSFIVTGAEVLGETQRNKQIRYVTVHCKQTETGFTAAAQANEFDFINPSSCTMQIRWGWSDSSAGRWSTAREVYRLKRFFIPEDANDTFDYGQSVVTTKNRVRGNGTAIAVKFSSTGQKQLHLLGWATTYTGNTRV